MSISLILVTLFSLCLSLWIRRATWKTTYERAATINLLLQGLAVILMSPWASQHLGIWLQAITGWANLEDYIAHDAYVVAASAVAYNALGRVDEGPYLERSFKLYVEVPATLAMPLMLLTFTLSDSTDHYADDFFQLPVDFWLAAYWVIACVTLIHLLGYGCKMLVILRDDPRSTLVADAYLISCLCGIMASLTRVFVSLVPGIPPAIGSAVVWLFACACGVGFAVTGAASWMGKDKQETEYVVTDDQPPRRPEPV
ncbi:MULTISPECIES: hypothetical protein [Mycobacteroides]|uniref:hypothetical protein n=1 Tax=Mycobacteroides TaxID=670516 RepID=UPI000925FD72|nr:hypothetical protein [Mycobacteroides abscessus]NGX06404.1 hypothetical protein [Mycobacteroides franklinii]SHT24039.1 GP55 protein [Mycobacteroides abscessus subsp. abscessus]SHW68135.1 GP55 protein [Mycobacteroides abscessus subsp. abscessus]SHY69553.1 GP55 protein [Mycobacteroides abscessus subsp. abscessus]SHZ45900.1 GP55 protein [Mycobacteroides abscessus subsp. abscessus]